ncbi:MAG TPA: methionyl-tRNA formyltransferase, partial [Planctomycetes bacterium]|nr:methionyl-tRNA formyltransferase [Planctomycetota bacterium]
MRIIVMGTGPFAVPMFESILAAGHDVPVVVTRPLPPARGRK